MKILQIMAHSSGYNWECNRLVVFMCFSKLESPYLELYVLVVLFHAFNLKYGFR